MTEYYLKCFSCSKEIKQYEKRIVIIAFEGVKEKSRNRRINYCPECFMNHADSVAIEALQLNTKIDTQGSNELIEWIGASIFDPLDTSKDWYCINCHNMLSGLERDVMYHIGRFCCCGCNSYQGNIVYKK